MSTNRTIKKLDFIRNCTNDDRNYRFKKSNSLFYAIKHSQIFLFCSICSIWYDLIILFQQQRLRINIAIQYQRDLIQNNIVEIFDGIKWYDLPFQRKNYQ